MRATQCSREREEMSNGSLPRHTLPKLELTVTPKELADEMKAAAARRGNFIVVLLRKLRKG
jgi:hypothetical protein